jgi:uncharacterized protein (DUF433 family)
MISTTTPPPVSHGETGLPPPTPRDHIVMTPGICGGKPRIAGHRIKVSSIAVSHERMGLAPDQIVQNHPGLTLGEVYAALSYYWDHREEIDSEISAAREFTEEMRKNWKSKIGPAEKTDGANDSLSS